MSQSNMNRLSELIAKRTVGVRDFHHRADAREASRELNRKHQRTGCDAAVQVYLDRMETQLGRIIDQSARHKTPMSDAAFQNRLITIAQVGDKLRELTWRYRGMKDFRGEPGEPLPPLGDDS